MKPLAKILLSSVALAGLALALNGCAGGYAEVGSDPYYHRDRGYRDRWYDDGPWMDGPRGYHQVRVAPSVRIRGTVRIP
jgi:hypothetical protein